MRVFENVTQATTILIFQKAKKDLNRNIINIIDPVTDIDSLTSNDMMREYFQELFISTPENMIITKRTAEQINIIEKILKKTTPFENFADIYQGEVNVSIYKNIIATTRKSKTYKPLLRGNNISRYYVDLSFTDKKGSWVDSTAPFRNHQDETRIVTQEVSNMH